jgi:hypothetical protein
MRARNVLSGSAVVVLVGLGIGCSDNKAVRIAVESPSAPIADDRPFTLKAVLVNKAGETLEQQLAYSSNPAGIVEVRETGNCRCLTDGDATVLVSGAGLSAIATIRCRMVAAIDASREMRLVVGQSPEVHQAKVIGRDGKAIRLAWQGPAAG